MTTKIGLLSDVHADIDSFEKAMNLLAEQQVDEIYCCGDLVEKGPNGDAVIEALQEHDIPCVMGNHDHYVIRYLANLHDDRGQSEHGLSQRTIDYLNNLPNYLKLEREGKHIFLAHGTPYDKYEYLFLNSPTDLYQMVVEEAEHADVVILGHTHSPMIVRAADTIIVNPGSVCGAFSFGSSTCAVLTLPDGIFDVYHIATGELVHAEHRMVEDVL